MSWPCLASISLCSTVDNNETVYFLLCPLPLELSHEGAVQFMQGEKTLICTATCTWYLYKFSCDCFDGRIDDMDNE